MELLVLIAVALAVSSWVITILKGGVRWMNTLKNTFKGPSQHHPGAMGELVNLKNQIFPNGQKDINQGTRRLLDMLGNTITKKQAENIFVKSLGICHLTSLREPFSKERLRTHLEPYALHHFNEDTFDEFYEFIVSKSDQAQKMNRMVEDARAFSRSTNPTGTDGDEMPEGHGEFGLVSTNPIPTSSIPDSYFYLNRLTTKDGSEVSYKRTGSMSEPNIGHSIDRYIIISGGQEIATIYICPYSKKTSTRAPKGFNLS